MSVWSSVKLPEILQEDRLDAEFFRPEHIARAKRLRSMGAVSLGSVCSVTNGKTPPEYFEDGPQIVVRSGDLNNPFVDVRSGHGYFRSQGLPASAKLLPSDVLISSIGVGSIGKIGIVDDADGLFTVSEVTIARSKEVPQEFLFAYLSSSFGLGEIERRVTGATGQQHLIKSNAEAVLIPPFPSPGIVANVQAAVKNAFAKRITARRSIAAAESRLMEALGLDALDLTPQKTYARRFKDLQDEARFDAEYFNPKYQKVIRRLREGGLTLSDVARIAQRTFNPTKRETGSTFNYIEIGSLTGNGEADAEVLDVADAPSRAKWIVKPGDIITSTVRPIRRLSAMIRSEQDGYVCSSGFAVLKPKAGKHGTEPEVLLTYLRLPLICELLDLNCTASMYPAISEDRLMKIPFVVPDSKTRKFVVNKVREAIEARREAARLLEQAKQTVEDLIAEGGNGKER